MEGFARTETEWMDFARRENCDHGTTAVVVILSNHTLYTANVGDSRAILVRSKQALPLSFDHKPQSPNELKRITENHGEVKRRTRTVTVCCCIPIAVQVWRSLSVLPFLIVTSSFSIWMSFSYSCLLCFHSSHHRHSFILHSFLYFLSFSSSIISLRVRFVFPLLVLLPASSGGHIVFILLDWLFRGPLVISTAKTLHRELSRTRGS